MPRKERLSPLQVYRMLPRTNCKLCGCMTCYAFAFSLLRREKKPTDCPSLLEEELRPTFEFLQDALGGDRIEGTDIVLNREKCHGCGICEEVCNRAVTTIVVPATGRAFKREPVPSVFKMVDGTVAVLNWSSCRRVSGGTLCTLCEEKCPFQALTLT